MDVTCAECSSPMVQRESKYGKFYGCSRFPLCKATHGAHPDGRPLGIPADKKTKAARIRAHAEFDAFWMEQGWTRGRAYGWLVKHGPAPHIAEMTEEDCEKLIEILYRTREK